MGRHWIVLLVSLLVVVPSYGATGNIRIGFVDVSKVFDEYPETKKATEVLNKEIEVREAKIGSLQSEITQIEKEIQGLENEKAVEKKRAILEEKKRELKEYADDARRYLIEREQELTKAILEKIYEAIRKVAAKKKLSMVLEKKTILYGAKDLDLTSEVIKVLKGE